MPNSKLFTPDVKVHSPLSLLLADPARLALDNASGVSPSTLAEQTDDVLVEHYLQAWDQRFPPAVVLEPTLPSEPRPAERRPLDPDDPDDRLNVWRWVVKFRIGGQTETLTRWPAGFSDDPCGESTQYRPLPWVCWELSASSVIGFFDVPIDDDPGGTSLPGTRVVRATAYLKAAADAANAEVAQSRRQVEVELKDLLTRRRRKLAVIEHQRSDLIELVRQVLGPIEIERVEDPQVPTAVAGTTGEEIALNYVVSDGSFEQLIAVTRKWARGAETYPDAFGPLQEEAITSLLVTTLNVAFDVALREVFQGKGKTDIFVQAILGASEKAAYIGEAKIWRGQKRVHTGRSGKPSDVDQLLGYAGSRTSQMLLIYYVRQKQREPVERDAAMALGKCGAFDRWEEQGADDVLAAVMRHPEYGNEIRLSVLFVHLPVENAPDPDDDVAEDAGSGAEP